ncbi:aldehyde dehydrogenase n-terminal [Fusarium mundagurra]|uniref:Putative aldehyde dehydrogenase FUS7 n=1 Tax=Fusarium mundagurra TaxID=1567541 RepID=A0A8H6D409_9HYPO|nr:aldehyde dehydrogenase n-terminal [Fusarium mundagurra]
MEFFNIVGSQKLGGTEHSRTLDPRTKEDLWSIPVANGTDLDNAVKAADEAFKSWRSLSLEKRQQCVSALAEILTANRADIHTILAKDTGKSLLTFLMQDLLTNIEIDGALDFINFNASQSVPNTVDYEDDKMKIVSTHPPIGVVGAIRPWNFPLVLATAKISASLVMGNCIIVKPSPYTPYTTLKFAELALSVLPPGVFQALNGNNDVGRLMTVHPGIHKITFTGSTATGKKVLENAAKTMKKVTLELGGNDPSIICPDVDVKHVAKQVATGAFYHAGQMCIATKRIYVHKDVFTEFSQAFLAAAKATQIDPSGRQPSLFGPLQNEMQYGVIKDLINDSKAQGLDIACGGEVGQEQGLFIKPTVVIRPPDTSRIVKDEQFGPIIPLLEWSSEEEVIERANATVDGLGACVWAKDAATAERIASSLQSGTVWINSFEIPHPHGYFSGWKQSGVGGEWGRQGLLSYCQTRVLHIYK